MNVFFEASGTFKVGTIISQHNEVVQITLLGGKQLKVKIRNVIIKFTSFLPEEFIQLALHQSNLIDLDFLWKISDDNEFNSYHLATEYFGNPSIIEYAAMILCLNKSPIYFRRIKKRGVYYKRIPEAQLKITLLAIERRSQQKIIQNQYENELKLGRLPAVYNGKVIPLLISPDKNSIEFKAMEAAAIAKGITSVQLMIECGGLPSVQKLLEKRFSLKYFPQGINFPAIPKYNFSALSKNRLLHANVEAFSVDDIITTEIDDAFSVQELDDKYHVRIGIHIAAPALGIKPYDEIDRIARSRLSTVYMPGKKITMLPETVIESFTLKEKYYKPALSLYFIVNSLTQEIVNSETCIELVFIKTNIRYNEWEHVITKDNISKGIGDYPHKTEIMILWSFTEKLYEKRQQARIACGLNREIQRKPNFNFYVRNDGHILIQQRPYNSPLASIVAELAILTNSSWAKLLSENNIPAIYRTQRNFGSNRTQLQTIPAPHEGLGVTQYAWSTSPLRRYIDLVNQWQLIALIRYDITAKIVAPFKKNDNELYLIAHHFDEIYLAYSEHQQRMERFWCLRWLEQEKGGIGSQIIAIVIKSDLLRLEEIPLQFTLPGINIYPYGTRVLLLITDINFFNITINTKLLHVINSSYNNNDQISE